MLGNKYVISALSLSVSSHPTPLEEWAKEILRGVSTKNQGREIV
jgi:hypothetical protein